MNGALEDLLREGLDRLTAEVKVPAAWWARHALACACGRSRFGPRWSAGLRPSPRQPWWPQREQARAPRN